MCFPSGLQDVSLLPFMFGDHVTMGSQGIIIIIVSGRSACIMYTVPMQIFTSDYIVAILVILPCISFTVSHSLTCGLKFNSLHKNLIIIRNYTYTCILN